MEEITNMSDELVEAGLAQASGKVSQSNYGTKYLDRTIFHTVYLTDLNGNNAIDDKGKRMTRNQVLYLAGSYISDSEYEEAMKVEVKFIKLNELLRKDMETKNKNNKNYNWRLRHIDQKALSIQGLTGV